MKILIISTGRAGSNSLSMGLQQSLNNYKLIIEPFNDYYFKNKTNPLSYSLTEKNLIVKTLSHQVPLELYQFMDVNLIKKQTIDFYLKYSSLFEKVILLGRKSKKDAAESWKKLFLQPYPMDSYYIDYTNLTYIDFLSHVSYTELILETISDIKNIPIIYYEDLCSGNKKYIDTFLNNNEIKLDNSELYNILYPINHKK